MLMRPPEPNLPDTRFPYSARVRYIARRAAREAMAIGEGPAALLREATAGLPMITLARYSRLPEARVVLPEDALRIAGSDGEHAILSSHWDVLGQRVVDFLDEWHRRHPDEPGLDAGRLQRRALPGIATGPWPALDRKSTRLNSSH